MKGKKDQLAKWLHRLGFLNLLKYRYSNHLIVINYHRIRLNKKNITLFDDDVFGPSRNEFNQQLKWLKKNVDIISENDLIDIANGVINCPIRGVMITFDDGYIDNFKLAYPLLRDHGLPAIFFIPTKTIEERTLGWWDHIAYMLKMTKYEPIIFDGKKIYPKSDLKNTIRYILSLIWLNRMPVDELLSELSKTCNVSPPMLEIQEKELMSWDNLKEVSRNGINIGSHTHSHIILSSLDLETQKYEMIKSKQVLEKKLGYKIRSISYPVGNYIHFNNNTKSIARECGYDLAFSFLTGINSWTELDKMDVKRIPVSGYYSRFIGEMTVPRIFCDCV